jgi:hypothetical protein
VIQSSNVLVIAEDQLRRTDLLSNSIGGATDRGAKASNSRYLELASARAGMG